MHIIHISGKKGDELLVYQHIRVILYLKISINLNKTSIFTGTTTHIFADLCASVCNDILVSYLLKECSCLLLKKIIFKIYIHYAW